MGITIIHVVESLKPEAGSAILSIQGLIRALAATGIESQVVAGDNQTGCVVAPGSIRETSQPISRTVEGATLVHVHGAGYGAALAAIRWARHHRKPLVISPLGSFSRAFMPRRGWLSRWKYGAAVRWTMKRASAVTALHDLEARELRANRRAGEIPVLPYGIDFDEYDLTNIAPFEIAGAADQRCILFLGPIDPEEGLVPLLYAFGGLAAKFPDWRVVFAGPQRRSWREQLEAAIRRKGGSDRVTFVVDPDEATQKAVLRRASAVVVPSLYSRCAVSVVQALAAGVPVLASPHASPDGMHEALNVCRPSREELTQALRDMMDRTDDERARIATHAREVSRKVLDWSALVDRYLTLYDGLMNRCFGNRDPVP